MRDYILTIINNFINFLEKTKFDFEYIKSKNLIPKSYNPEKDKNLVHRIIISNRAKPNSREDFMVTVAYKIGYHHRTGYQLISIFTDGYCVDISKEEIIKRIKNGEYRIATYAEIKKMMNHSYKEFYYYED